MWKVVRTKIVPIIITALGTMANYYYKLYKSAEQAICQEHVGMWDTVGLR
jgi:hypothetical protein